MIGANLRMVWLGLSLLILVLLCEVSSQNYSNEDEMYGKTWIYFPDGDGNPQVAYLTEPDGRSRANARDVKDYVSFELYTKKTASQPKVMHLRKKRKRSVDEFTNTFDADLPTYVVVHGWKSGTTSDTVQNIKDGYLNTRDCNVIAVDWEEVAANNFYLTPARQTKDVGQYVADMIDYLCKERGADINKFHLIGHSLGAHTVGYAGTYVKSGRIPRITGLDPARPMFEGMAGPDSSLDKSDADFVDVIHSSAGSLGYMQPIGHVDFYPNGGRASQPGCNGIWMEIMEACSHGRSHQFFAESITSKLGFTGYPCSSYSAYEKGNCAANGIPMGDPTPKSARGVYYLKTTDRMPFAMGRRK